MKKMKCSICEKFLKDGEGYISNVDREGKATENGVVVCGEDCKNDFQNTLNSGGKPLYHLSRITGYVQIVDNWNEGKKQEFKDRIRTKV